MGVDENMDYDIRTVQLVELDILKKIDRICKKHGITYFLDGGTALGAVRHGGFIPWDDDIDLGMLRDDYDRFIEIAQAELGNDYFLQTRKTDPKCPFSFAKVRKEGTTFVEWNKRNVKMHHGIFVDIFPYDVLPEEGREEYFRKCAALDRKLTVKMTPDRAMQPQRSLKWLAGSMARRAKYYLMKFTSTHKLDKKIEEEFVKYRGMRFEDQQVTCHAYDAMYYFPEDMLVPTVTVEFEGERFPIPGKYHEFLTKMYGDYMELPPEEERHGHKPAKLSVTEVLY